MRGKWTFRVGIVIGILCGVARSVPAAPPWTDLISLRSIDADPKRAYPAHRDQWAVDDHGVQLFGRRVGEAGARAGH